MAETILELLIILLYVYCISYAVVSDIRELRIPNWIPIALTLGFVPYAILSLNDLDLPTRLVVVVIIFCIAFALFYKRFLGGGDVTLLSAVALWIAPADIFVFIALMGLIGATLALFVMLMRQHLGIDWVFAWAKVPQSVVRWIRQGICPYGAAIGLAGLIMTPQVFGRLVY